MADLQNPLNDSHCTTLDCVLQRIADTQTLVSKCQNCGLDTSAAAAELQRQYELASKLKATFFPNNP